MATNLTGTSVNNTYNQLLHIDGGPTAVEKTVYSGTGVATALKLGTESVLVDNVRVDGSTISTVAPDSDLVLAPNGSGSVQITGAVSFQPPAAAGNPLIRGGNVWLPNGIDLNTVVDTGFYRLNLNIVNGPTSVVIDFGQLIVSKGGDTITQIVANYSTGEMWTRSGNPPAIGGPGAWSPWRAITGVGVSQTWQDVTSSRGLNVTYYNTTNKPILVEISTIGAGVVTPAYLLIDNTLVCTQNATSQNVARLSGIVPVASSYSLAGVPPQSWVELR